MDTTGFRRVLITAAVLLLGCWQQPSWAMQLPANSGVLNVKDFGAKGDGVTDDTAAINRAIAASTPAANTGNYWGQAKIVYFPSGRYVISAPLIKNNGSGDPTYGMVLIGESEGTTTLELEPHAPGFGDPSNPLGMIHPTADAAYGYSPEAGDGNDAYQNTIQNLTIGIGTGNPGAIGIDYLANNLGAIRNVAVNAPRGEGVAGIRMTRPLIGPALLENVTVNGFAVGLDVANLQYALTLDHVSLNGQTVAGLRNAQDQIAANGLMANTAGPAVVNSSADGEVVLTGAVLRRARGYKGATMTNEGTIVFRNSNWVDGYQAFTGSNLPGNVVSGVWSPKGFVNGASGSFNTSTAILSPPPAIEEPVSRWVSVAAFGAQPSADFTDTNDNVPSVVDAAAGIQAAMNSGAATIYFPHGVYYISQPITIPATVQRIVGLDSSLHPTIYESWRSEGMFRILANARTPLTIEQLRFDNSNDGTQLAIEQDSNRTVVLRDTMFPGTLAVNRIAAGGQLYMEDVSAAGSNVTLAGGAAFEATQFDFENCGTCMYLSGVPAEILGFKEEGDTTEIAATDGTKADVLGGLAYMVYNGTDPSTPLFSADAASRLTASFDEAVISPQCPCRVANYLDQIVSGQNYDTPSSGYFTRSDTGHVVGMLRTGPSIVSPSSIAASPGKAVSIAGITVRDFYAGGSSTEMTLGVSATGGTIALTGADGKAVAGSGSRAVELDGSLSEVNAALATLRYTARPWMRGGMVSITVSNALGEHMTQETFVTATR
jgi:hypothetical protein